MKHIVIIGGGASGILSLYRIVEGATNLNITIHLIEKETQFGGLAYNLAALPMMVHNTQIHSMSAFEDKPNDLLDYLNSPNTDRSNWPLQYKNKIWEKTEFCPRQLYGFYLRNIFQIAMRIALEKNIRIIIYHNTVVDMKIINANLLNVVLDNQESVLGNVAILCLGQLSSDRLPFKVEVKGDPKLITDVWSSEGIASLKNLPVNDDILVVGTGLTANDIIMQRNILMQKSEKKSQRIGHTYLVSRHGLMHIPYQNNYIGRSHQDLKLPEEMKSSPLNIPALREYLPMWAKNLFKQGMHSEEIYRATIRNLIPAWSQMSKDERYAFFKKYKHLDVYRTGISSDVCDVVNQMKKDNQLTLLTGEIHTVRRDSDKLLVILEVKRKNIAGGAIKELVQLRVDTIFNATGFESSLQSSSSHFVQSMMLDGGVKENYLGLGFECNSSGQLLNNVGNDLLPIFSVGALSIGPVFESEGKLGSARSIAGIRKNVVKTVRSIFSYINNMEVESYQMQLLDQPDRKCEVYKRAGFRSKL